MVVLVRKFQPNYLIFRKKVSQGTSRFLSQRGADAPPLASPRGGGGHFKVKEGHPHFLQIKSFFLTAVLLLYLKLFTFLEIITMLYCYNEFLRC